MTNFVELMIPIDRDWLVMLDRVALPVVQSLPQETPYFFTNDGQKVLRLRIEEQVFELHKQQIYTLLLAQLQSDEKVKVYKQNYLIEEARFGKFKNPDLHTLMFYHASTIMITLLEEAEQIDQYENRLPYAVLALYFMLSPYTASEQDSLAELYIKHWMYFNEHTNYSDLVKDFQDTYKEEANSLRSLIASLDQQKELALLFRNWKLACLKFAEAMQETEHIHQTSHRQEAYYYKENKLSDPRKWEVIADHIHLLMNRFDILNEDETLVMFLTRTAMKSD